MGTKIVVLLFGLAFAAVGYTYISLAYRMRSFRSVPGRVIKREVVVVPSGNTTTGRWGDGGGYTPQLTYRYVVDGVELESNKLGRLIYGYKHAVAERKLAEIPDQVVVWYDAKKPSEAYLRKNGPAFGCLLMVLGMCLAIGALIGLSS
jgi:hypothetical protein